MSMDFSEFKRRLSAEPRSRDPDLLRARDEGPEFAAAAAAADRFEGLLEAALALPEPEDLVESLRRVPAHSARNRRNRWVSVALAAGLLLAMGGAGLNRLLHPHWDSVEDYVIDHYYHDGVKLLAADQQVPDAGRIEALFDRFDVEAAPALADIVGVIKICVTPDGQGIHMVLNTASGPVTVFYMPETPVEDAYRPVHDSESIRSRRGSR